MNNNSLIQEMIRYYSGDPKRIQHFIKVYTFAKMIGEEEGLDESTQKILETAAIVHDIGIKLSEEKYGSSNGKYQELEGPAVAEEMLDRLGYEKELTSRVCWLIAHHHTYSDIQGADYQILVEADFLVNLFEDGSSASAVQNALERIFRTETGEKICREMFDLPDVK